MLPRGRGLPRLPGFQIFSSSPRWRPRRARPAGRGGGAGGCGRQPGELETWNAGNPRGAAWGGSTRARRCPECPRGAHSGGGHGAPHGPAARVPRGRRDATSEEVHAGARESVHRIGLARSLRNACNRRNTRARRGGRQRIEDAREPTHNAALLRRYEAAPWWRSRHRV